MLDQHAYYQLTEKELQRKLADPNTLRVLGSIYETTEYSGGWMSHSRFCSVDGAVIDYKSTECPLCSWGKQVNASLERFINLYA